MGLPASKYWIGGDSARTSVSQIGNSTMSDSAVSIRYQATLRSVRFDARKRTWHDILSRTEVRVMPRRAKSAGR